jgi:hypothetical protein
MLTRLKKSRGITSLRHKALRGGGYEGGELASRNIARYAEHSWASVRPEDRSEPFAPILHSPHMTAGKLIPLARPDGSPRWPELQAALASGALGLVGAAVMLERYESARSASQAERARTNQTLHRLDIVTVIAGSLAVVSAPCGSGYARRTRAPVTCPPLAWAWRPRTGTAPA